jgi:hypothetical protein
MQPRRGAAEVPFLGDGDEVAQVPQLHAVIYIENVFNRHLIGVAECITAA